ncbi:hypothetical protein [Olivibacter sitiensis]|uniref:hypothetical protein n=1 Tax=Olivibacter sitiensis TaxID=376470 RepID=UPI0003FF5E2F|nr:hypothetical protein [Olivibacter sitiensis]
MINQYDIIRIDRYINGQMSSDEMYQLEREALDDPFLSEALEGYRTAQQVNQEKLSLLQQRLQSRIAQQPEERSRMLFTWQRLGVAGVASLFLILTCILLWMRGGLQHQNSHDRQVVLEIDSREGIPNQGGIFTARKLEANSAEPVGGWDALNSYIARHKITTERGHIIVHADIDSTGKAINLRFEQGNARLEKEVERLLKDGPKWKGSKSLGLEFVF